MKILIAASNMVHINNFHRPYIEEMRRRGNEVFIMASGEGADFNVPFKKNAMSLKNLFLSRKIKKILKSGQFDVVYLHTTLAAFWVRMAMKGMKKRPYVINTVHGYLFGEGFSRLHNFVYLKCEKIVRHQTDEILVMNDEDFEIAKNNQLCKGNVTKIYGMGVRFPEKRIISEEKEDKSFRLVFVGEISKRKNQMLLLRALEKIPNASLTLVGDGDERENILRYAKKHGLSDRLTITGFVKDVYPYIAEASIYVSASYVEGLPFNILEAMHQGATIVASNVKGHRDLLPPEMLFTSGSENELVQLLSTVSVEKRQYDVSKYSFESAFYDNMNKYMAFADEREMVKIM